MPPLEELVIGIAIIAALAFVAVKMNAIDILGALSGAVISFIAFIAGGPSWLLIIIIFFGVSSALTRYRYEEKRKIGSAQEKEGRRSWPNSIANAGVALIASLGQIFFPSGLFAVAFLASISTAMADTIATEVGVLSESTPRLITNPRKSVKPGTSGGVSGLGESAALLSSVSMAVVGLLLYMFNPEPRSIALVLPSVVAGAMVGTNFDSFLGATVQSLYRCEVCSEFTEGRTHHGKKTVKVKGVSFIENNTVNFLGTAVGVVISLVIFGTLNYFI